MNEDEDSWCEKMPSNETIAEDQQVQIELVDAVRESDAASGKRAAHRTLVVGGGARQGS